MEDDEHYSSSVLNENMEEKGSKEDHVSQEQSTKQPLLEKGKIKKTPNMDYILKRYELIIKKEEQNIRFT